jgi:hypothetical protein
MLDGVPLVLAGGNSSIEQTPPPLTPSAMSKARPASRRLTLAVLT